MTDVLPFDARAITNAEVAEIVTRARKRAGLTQEQLATRLSKHRNSIWQWERGHDRISAVDFVNLLDICGLVVTVLPTRTNRPPSKAWTHAHQSVKRVLTP